MFAQRSGSAIVGGAVTVYIVRRLISAVPTLVLISILVFVALDVMPGSYVDLLVAQQIQETGEDELSQGQIKILEKRYGLGKPIYVRWWLWFSRFVQGDLGRSWSYNNKPVAELITDRLALTVLISLVTTVFVYLVAFPIGIYSAVRQYSLSDNVFTFFGFIGLSIPNFLLALVFIVIGFFWFGQIPGGLFSPQYADQPWSLAKFLDLLSHLWIPVIVLGTAGTAGTIRVLRGNMLEEMTQPYVDTARAKGLKERTVLLKYPLRIALNPFITSMGYFLPGLISGEVIVSIVLNLPTTGPLLYDAIMHHDAFLAGGMVMVLSVLLVVGNLLADLLLVWVDPRIRYTNE